MAETCNCNYIKKISCGGWIVSDFLMYNALYNRPRSLVVLQLGLETILALLNLISYVCVDLRVQDKLCEADDKKNPFSFKPQSWYEDP